MSAKTRIYKAEQAAAQKNPPEVTYQLFWTLPGGTYQDVQTGRIVTEQEQHGVKTIRLKWRTGGDE